MEKFILLSLESDITKKLIKKIFLKKQKIIDVFNNLDKISDSFSDK